MPAMLGKSLRLLVDRARVGASIAAPPYQFISDRYPTVLGTRCTLESSLLVSELEIRPKISHSIRVLWRAIVGLRARVDAIAEFYRD